MKTTSKKKTKDKRKHDTSESIGGTTAFRKDDTESMSQDYLKGLIEEAFKADEFAMKEVSDGVYIIDTSWLSISDKVMINVDKHLVINAVIGPRIMDDMGGLSKKLMEINSRLAVGSFVYDENTGIISYKIGILVENQHMDSRGLKEYVNLSMSMINIHWPQIREQLVGEVPVNDAKESMYL